MVAVAQRIYAEEWDRNAAEYQSQGMYEILADRLRGAGELRTLLDIGCGLGHGLVAIRSALGRDTRLIGVDENPECLAVAATLLGVDAVPRNIRRMRDSVLDNGFHLSTYDEGALELQDGITLVQSDVVVQDPALEQLLDRLGPVDAVTLWFSGIHKARSAMELARHYEIKSDADHRTLVEDRALAIADERLRPGGLLHVVSRVAANEIEAVAQHSAGEYAAWLEGWPFALETVAAIPYHEPEDGIRVRSRDARVNTMPGYALSMLIRRIA